MLYDYGNDKRSPNEYFNQIENKQKMSQVQLYILISIDGVTIRWTSKYVMWSEKMHHMVQNWYFEFLVSSESLNLSSLQNFFTWISSDTDINWCSKAIKIKEKH